MKIGNKIKLHRQKKGVTQEQLADAIGISFQAVSKWETGIALPDITLVPVLAAYFGVTTDELFDFNLHEINEKVTEICHDAARYRESDPQRSRAILERALESYPDNEILLNNLLYVIEDEPNEVIRIASKLVEQTNEPEIKYDALRCLAYAYRDNGDMDATVAAIEQIPEIYFTKLTVQAFLLEGKQKFDAAEKQKWISYEDLLRMMVKMAECYEVQGNISAALAETERALKLIDAMEDEPKISNFRNYVDFFRQQIEKLRAFEEK